MRNEKIGFEHQGIGESLANNRFVVPLNQREYAWEDEHVRALFEDFASAIAQNKGTYFLGTIVLTQGDKGLPEVSDGQQRLATTTILLAAIRDYWHRNSDLKRAHYVESTYLLTTDVRTTEIAPKLCLNVDDNVFFTKFVLSSPDSPDRKVEPTRESHKRIKNAAEIAKEFVKKILEPHSSNHKTQRLLDWLDFVQKGSQVILLSVPDHMNAFMMFETLNDRGLKASQADLLKNHLLSLSDDRIKEAQHQWAKMIGVLESMITDDITVTYLHHLLITKFGPTKEREVFGKIKDYANSQSLALSFLDELASGANDYAALFNSDHKKWNEYGSATRKHISIINRDLRVTQIQPLMFAVARHFSVKEAEKAFRLFVYWSVRFFVVGVRGGVLDTRYSTTAKSIGDKTIKTASELENALSAIVPSDALFETAFAEARVSQTRIARYYLRALEMKQNRQNEPELVPTEDERIINLEHILPENPQDLWPNIDSETAHAYYRRLGNMALLQATKNSIAGNSSFSDKKEVFAVSNFSLTSEVGKYDTWGVEEIEARQKILAKLAVSTWPSKLPRS